MMKFAIASVAALLVAAPAFAADFSGFRLEANGGWDRVGLKVDGDKAHKDGFVFGAETGWDYESNGFLFGPYAGVDISTAKYCERSGSYRACAKARRNFEVGARVGAVVSPVSLVYAKVAYVNGRVSASESYSSGSTSYHNEEGVNRGGFRAGVGTEYLVGGNVYVKAEYRYTRYKSLEDVKINRNQVVGGVGYRF